MSFKILGISGSLRKASFNSAALRAAVELAPEGVEVTIFDGLRDIPPYDDDLRSGSGYPAPVAAFRTAIREADALLFASPEYNFSISGVLKNAIDWASRPYGQSAWAGKTAAIMGASIGAIGTARAQYHLRQVLVALDARVMNLPEVMIGQVQNKVDADAGRLIDGDAREHIRRQLDAFVRFIRR